MDIDTNLIAQKVENGSYFHEGRRWYHLIIHAPMAERSFFIVVTVLCIIMSFVCIFTYQSLFPLRPAVPFVVRTDDLYENLPRMVRLAADGEDSNVAVQRHMLSQYVKVREHYEYDKKVLERNFYGVRSNSSKDTFNQYNEFMNSDRSPLLRYGKEAKRLIDVYGVVFDTREPGRAQVLFQVNLEQGGALKTSNWVADITFRYKNFQVEREFKDDGEMVTHYTPMEFVITNYETRLQNGS